MKKPHDLSIFSVFEHDRRVKYRSNMLSLCETSSSLLFKNRAASLVLLTVTLVFFLQATGNVLCNQPILITLSRRVKINTRNGRVHYYYAEEALYLRIASVLSARLFCML